MENNNRTRLTLEKRHQLIDLNKEYVNFDITFECRSVDATKEFEIIVVNQEQLNTIDLTNLTMKRTNGGYISGNIIADEDKYQNYFLIMRSATEEPVEVDMDIRIRQIDPKINEPPQPPPETYIPPPEDQLMHHPSTDMGQSSSLSANQTHMMYMVIVLLLVGGAVGYYFWTRHKTHGKDDDTKSVCSVVSQPPPSVCSSSSSFEEGGLLDALINKSNS